MNGLKDCFLFSKPVKVDLSSDCATAEWGGLRQREHSPYTLNTLNSNYVKGVFSDQISQMAEYFGQQSLMRDLL